jgi:hypothetical protein
MMPTLSPTTPASVTFFQCSLRPVLPSALQGVLQMKNAGRFPLMALFASACASLSSAQDTAPNDALALLRQARSLRCTYTASSLTSFRPDRRITVEHDQMVVVYDNIDIKRTARVIYEKGVPGGGAGDLTARWQANALWLIETAPAGNLILTTIFPRYADGTRDFIALDSRHSAVIIVSGSMSSGTCKAVT